MNSIRVLLITDHFDGGGVSAVILDLSRELTARGHLVTVAAAGGGGSWELLSEKVRRFYLPNRRGFGGVGRLFSLARIVRSGEFDVIHAHQRGLATLSVLVRRRKGPKVAEHVHNIFLPVSARVLSFRGHRLLACGSAVAEMLNVNYGRNRSKIDLVLNGVKDLAGSSDIRLPATRGHRNKEIRLVGVGRLTTQKDPLRFIEVAIALRSLGVNVHAMWIGDGELLNDCRYAVQLACASDYVEFIGHSENVREEFLRADALLMTSKWEGLPLVILEALSLGRPVFAPNVGSCNDAVLSNENGIVYDPALSPLEIATLLAPKLLPSTLTRWGQRSRRLFEERFRLERMVEDVESAYQRILTPTSH